MRITHTIYTTNLYCYLDLKDITKRNSNIICTDHPFKMITWRHPKIKDTCLMYESGKLICHGTKSALRKYCRLLQKQGYPIHFTRIRLVTMSAMHVLNSPVNYSKLVSNMRQISYEAEFFHAPILRKEKLSFIIYQSGKVIITGIKSQKHIDDIVYPTLLEIEFST